MTYGNLQFELTERIATITLARPEKLNALTPDLLREIGQAIDEAAANRARAIILTGSGKAFCAGADMAGSQFGESGGGAGIDLGSVLDDYFNPLIRKIADLDIPVISAINGAAVGAGMALALIADITVMARSAYLLLSFVNVGLVPDAGATWLLAKAVGRTRALEYALLGERILSEEALSSRLVTRVVEDNELAQAARAFARKLADGPTGAIGMIRKQVAAALDQPLPDVLAIESRNQAVAGYSADLREAMAAFAEKRRPQFGRG